MLHPSRRRFLNWSLGLGTAAFLGLGRTEPDTILHNAQVITIDPRQPRAQAIAIAGDRFFAVGDNDEILALATGRTGKIDLGGKTIVPGFIEAGKLADLVVLGRDPLREDPATLVTIPIERTMVGGRWVWES